MCFTARWRQEESAEARSREEAPERSDAPQEPFETHPRGNQEPDPHELEKSVERLSAVVPS